MQTLMLHRECDLGPIKAVTAHVEATNNGCVAEFRLEGDISRIHVPARAEPLRTDELWKTTCFEIFWQPIGGSYYREFNLSPSTRWAVYDFDAFREGMRDAPAVAVQIECTLSERELVLTAKIVADLPCPAQVALNTIVDNGDPNSAGSNNQFWALAFPPGKPEFHSEACRQLIIDRG